MGSSIRGRTRPVARTARGRCVLLVAATVLAGSGLAPRVAAHGGQIITPKPMAVSGHPPFGPAGPSSNPGSGPTTGGGTGTRLPGAAPTTGPRNTGSGSGLSAKGRAATSGPGSGFVPIEERDAWEFWWANNRDVPLRGRDGGPVGDPRSGGDRVLTGRGTRAPGEATRRPDDALVSSRVAPLLLSLVAQCDDRDVLDSAILALARSARPGDEAAVLATARRLLAHRELSVKGSAALALGVLGSPRALPLLRALALDDADGRKAVGGGHVPDQVRGFAAVSLGLVGHDVAIPTLVALAGDAGKGRVDVPACAILALGLLPDDPAGEATSFLLGALADRRLDAGVRAQAPIALARLGRREALPALLDGLGRDTEESLVRQSCALALGRLANLADDGVVAALAATARDGRDAPTRHFAVMALARVAAGGADEPHPGRARVLGGFVDALGRAGRAVDRPWVALAAGFVGREQRDAREGLAGPLADAYSAQKDPSVRGAFALALGLSDQSPQAGQVYDDFLAASDEGFRADAALALGLLGHAPAAEELRRLCADRATSPPLRMAAAQALGLLADRAATPVLVAALRESGSQPMLSAVAKSLGWLADRDCVEPLMALAADDTAPELSRAFACVGLGLCCERTRLPWNARLREDGNYLARVPAIDELLDIL